MSSSGRQSVVNGIVTRTRRLGPPESAQPPVILLHGWGASLETWGPAAEGLAARDYAIYAVDMPGFGGTNYPPGAWDVGDYAGWVRDWMQSEGIDAANVIGHSFGGRVAIKLAASCPECVARLVLVDSAGVPARPGWQRTLMRWAGAAIKAIFALPGLRRHYARVRARLYRAAGSEDYVSAGPLKETFTRVIAEDLRPFARKIAAPTILIWGTEDADTPLWQGEELARCIPDSALIPLEGAGHYAFLDRPADFIAIVDRFLKDS